MHAVGRAATEQGGAQGRLAFAEHQRAQSRRKMRMRATLARKQIREPMQTRESKLVKALTRALRRAPSARPSLHAAHGAALV